MSFTVATTLLPSMLAMKLGTVTVTEKLVVANVVVFDCLFGFVLAAKDNSTKSISRRTSSTHALQKTT